MGQQVLEGTWEEIVQHADELSGKLVRLTVLDKSMDQRGENHPIEERPLSERLEGLIGVIDSSEPSPAFLRKRNAYGEAIIEKFGKQGLKLP